MTNVIPPTVFLKLLVSDKKVYRTPIKIYKELERLLKASGCVHSIDEVLRIAKTIVTVEIVRPENNDSIIRTLCLIKEEKEISYLIDTDDWLEF